MEKRNTVRALLMIGLIGAFAGPALAGAMELAWGAVPEATGYRLYYGTASGSYDTVADVGAQTQVTLQGLQDCTEYFVAVKAYNQMGESPEFSNEIQGWARPNIGVQTVATRQGDQLVIEIAGGNFDTLADVTVDTQTLPLGAQGETLIRIESVAVVECDRLQALVTVEPTIEGLQAMQLGDHAIAMSVRNPDGVFNSGTFTLEVGFDPSRADINRDSGRTTDRVDGEDLATFAQAWASSFGDEQFTFVADLDGDADVDGQDLALLAGMFGQCRTGGSWSLGTCS